MNSSKPLTERHLSDFCISNIKAETNMYNSAVVRNTPSKNVQHHNCQKSPAENCLINGFCLKENLV